MTSRRSTLLVRSILSLVFLTVLALGNARPAAAASIIFVKQSAHGANNGATWANAYTNLQVALGSASPGEQVWVAAGTYYPTNDSNRGISFLLKNGVAIYGGFAGGETVLKQRKPSVNITILNGNIANPSIATDNSYHVVDGSGANNTAILDGFKIVGGYANGLNPTEEGGGIYIGSGGPTLRNLTVNSNYAALYGGGVYAHGNPVLSNVVLNGNMAGNEGGGLFAESGSTAIVTNAIFSSNSAVNQGGGLFIELASSPKITNATFVSNTSTNGGGISIENAYPTFTNITVQGNTASNNGGGLYTYISTWSMTNATFSGNSAGVYGNGMYKDTDSTVTIYNSIFWGDGATEIGNESIGPTIYNSDIAGSACPGVCTNVTNADPHLGVLHKNGGFTQTMALGSGSAAIDQGDNATCAKRDQRGVLRPQGPACDAGAYEVRAQAFVSQGAYEGQVLETGKNTKVGGTVNSTGTTFNVGDDARNRRYRAFTSFDTSAVPDTARIVAVRLNVVAKGHTGDPFANQGTLLIDLANPYFGADPTLVSSDFQVAATLSAAGAVSSVPTASGFAGWLSGQGISKINKTGMTQFRLRFGSEIYDSAAEYVTFYSGDATNGALRPRLFVYYNP